MTGREKALAYGSWIAVCVLWGTTYLAIRFGLETLPPMLFGGLRFLLAGALLLIFVRWRGERLPVGREWFELSVVGLLLLAVGNGVVVWSEQWIPSGMVALLIATSPFWVAGAELLVKDGERVGRGAVFGMLVGFGGMALLVGPQLFNAQLDARYLIGVVALQVGCASWSGGSVYAKRHPTRTAPLMSAAVQMVVAGAALTLVGTIKGEWPLLRFSGRSFGAFMYLVVFGSLVAYSAYTYAIQKLPLSLVSTYSYINPVIAVLLGWLLLGEPLGWRVVVAAAIILLGVAAVKAAPRRRDGESVALDSEARESESRDADTGLDTQTAAPQVFSAGAK